MHSTVKRNIALAAVATIGICATIAAPLTTASVAIGGTIGYKFAGKIADKKYAARDIGGVFPMISSRICGALVGAFMLAAVSNTIIDNDNNGLASTDQVAPKQMLVYSKS